LAYIEFFGAKKFFPELMARAKGHFNLQVQGERCHREKGYQLGEGADQYKAFPELGNGDIGLKNSYFWNVNVEKSMCYLGPPPEAEHGQFLKQPR
jgi:hypothetical protein